MAPIAARKAAQIARNAAGVIAVELIAAAQGIDYHAPLKTSPKLQEIHAAVRADLAAFHRRPLLGRRDGRASVGGARRGDRRKASAAARLADPVPVRRLADHREHAAVHGQPIGPDLLDRAACVHVAAGEEHVGAPGPGPDGWILSITRAPIRWVPLPRWAFACCLAEALTTRAAQRCRRTGAMTISIAPFFHRPSRLLAARRGGRKGDRKPCKRKKKAFHCALLAVICGENRSAQLALAMNRSSENRGSWG